MPTNENPTKYSIYDRKLAAIRQLVAPQYPYLANRWYIVTIFKKWRQSKTNPKQTIVVTSCY